MNLSELLLLVNGISYILQVQLLTSPFRSKKGPKVKIPELLDYYYGDDLLRAGLLKPEDLRPEWG